MAKTNSLIDEIIPFLSPYQKKTLNLIYEGKLPIISYEQVLLYKISIEFDFKDFMRLHVFKIYDDKKYAKNTAMVKLTKSAKNLEEIYKIAKYFNKLYQILNDDFFIKKINLSKDNSLPFNLMKDALMIVLSTYHDTPLMDAFIQKQREHINFFKKFYKLSEIEEDSECPICLEKILNMDFNCKNKHYFHESCLKKWTEINSTCPVCRIPL